MSITNIYGQVNIDTSSGSFSIGTQSLGINKYTLPDIRGVEGQVLETDGLGVVVWANTLVVPTLGTLVLTGPDSVVVNNTVPFTLTVGNHPVAAGTIASVLFSCTTGAVSISSVATDTANSDTGNRVYTFNAAFNATGTQTLNFDNTGTTNVRNALGYEFLACTADMDVTVTQ